jgi:hypothetical protein
MTIFEVRFKEFILVSVPKILKIFWGRNLDVRRRGRNSLSSNRQIVMI